MVGTNHGQSKVALFAIVCVCDILTMRYVPKQCQELKGLLSIKRCILETQCSLLGSHEELGNTSAWDK